MSTHLAMVCGNLRTSNNYNDFNILHISTHCVVQNLFRIYLYFANLFVGSYLRRIHCNIVQSLQTGTFFKLIPKVGGNGFNYRWKKSFWHHFHYYVSVSLIFFIWTRNRFLSENVSKRLIRKKESIDIVKFIGRIHSLITSATNQSCYDHACYSFQVLSLFSIISSTSKNKLIKHLLHVFR